MQISSCYKHYIYNEFMRENHCKLYAHYKIITQKIPGRTFFLQSVRSADLEYTSLVKPRISNFFPHIIPKERQ